MSARTPLLVLALSALSSPALAQNDECTGALTLGLGATPFNTTSATTSLPGWACAGGGSDLWYRFTAPNDAVYTFDTCGSGYDSALELFTGTCAALVSVACNDDSCGLQSSLTWSLAPGNVVYLRVGGFNALTGTGTINVSEIIIPPPSGSASAWLAAVATGTQAQYSSSLLPGPVVEDIGMASGASSVTYEFVVHGTNAGASSALLGNLGAGLGSSGGLKFEQWPDTLYYGATEFGVVDHSFLGGTNTENADIHLVFVANIITDSTELFVNGVSFGTVPYAPLLLGMQGIGQIYRPNGSNLDVLTGRIRGVAVYDAALGLPEIIAHRDAYFSGSIGTVYCAPAVNNSTGNPSALSASGSAVASANNLTLEASSLPLNAFGYFLTSVTQGFVPGAGGSQGNLCLSGAIGRYVGPGQIKNSGLLGEFSLLLTLTQTPTPTGFVAVLAGQTRNFQAWHRDAIGGVATSNFTTGLSITFQ
jgi:hypothetical protein